MKSSLKTPDAVRCENILTGSKGAQKIVEIHLEYTYPNTHCQSHCLFVLPLSRSHLYKDFDRVVAEQAFDGGPWDPSWGPIPPDKSPHPRRNKDGKYYTNLMLNTYRLGPTIPPQMIRDDKWGLLNSTISFLNCSAVISNLKDIYTEM
jgi:hypothetical protein